MIYIYITCDFHEIISLVIYEVLTSLNIKCCLSQDLNNNQDKLWIFTESYFNLLKWPKRYIVYQVAPLNIVSQEYINFIKGAFQVWEYSDINLETTKSLNNNTLYIPFRYSKCIEKWHNIDEIPEKDIDILFIGYVTEYRESIFNELNKRNINIIIAPPCSFKKNRELLIKRSKIQLILSRCEDFSKYNQDISRIIIHSSRKDFCICYKIKDCCIKSMIQINDFDDLIDKINYYCNNENERNENINNVYNEVLNMKMEDIFKYNINNIPIK